jgi:hypothetical protein
VSLRTTLLVSLLVGPDPLKALQLLQLSLLELKQLAPALATSTRKQLAPALATSTRKQLALSLFFVFVLGCTRGCMMTAGIAGIVVLLQVLLYYRMTAGIAGIVVLYSVPAARMLYVVVLYSVPAATLDCL